MAKKPSTLDVLKLAQRELREYWAKDTDSQALIELKAKIKEIEQEEKNSIKTQQLYKVKLLPGHAARKDQNFKGYLGFNTRSLAEICEYTRGEAIKKARAFGGKIEKIFSNQLPIKKEKLPAEFKQVLKNLLADFEEIANQNTEWEFGDKGSWTKNIKDAEKLLGIKRLKNKKSTW